MKAIKPDYTDKECSKPLPWMDEVIEFNAKRGVYGVNYKRIAPAQEAISLPASE